MAPFFVVMFALRVIDFSIAFCPDTKPHMLPACRHAPCVSRKMQVFSSSANNLVDDETNHTTTSSMMTLNLVGKTVILSLPTLFNDSKSMHDFFALPRTAELLLKGSKNNTIHEIQIVDSELYEQYRNNCALLNASLPNSVDRIYNVTTSGVRFPGLNVMSIVTIGVKLISTSHFPSYEIVLIRDMNYAEGNPLFLWFFNKVTGNDKITKSGPGYKKVQSAFSINRISVVPKENGTIAFEGNATLSLLLQFPAFLFKALPGASKEKYEKTGGKYLKKALEDDLPAALEGLRREYDRWLQS
ncbi:hypothetical protein ACHAWU_001669 [Discostella pseudostelligera]|uniref:Uncharacterized protein n=1 Tax=Discostella pseudostelligera TaxID=259834 RepID=A0ABD3MFC3_9STRA